MDFGVLAIALSPPDFNDRVVKMIEGVLDNRSDRFCVRYRSWFCKFQQSL